MSRRQAGFTLVEVLVAVTVSAVVLSAVFALLGSGQSSFRREPAVADHLQNLRIALDVVQRDVASAGQSLSPWVQAFTPGLDGTGVATVPSVIQPGQRTDVLEMRAADSDCPTLETCKTPGVNIGTLEPIPACFEMPSLLYVMPEGGLHFGFTQGGGMGCGQGHINFPHGQAPGWNPPGGFCSGAGASSNCQYISKVRLIRYAIAPDPADGDLPGLWRSPLGQAALVGGNVTSVPTPPGGSWTLVARGVEDLQVEYRLGPASATWVGNAATVAGGDFATLVREVRITLSGRVVAANLPGQTAPSPAPAAIRSQLTTTVSPRGGLLALATNPDASQRWR